MNNSILESKLNYDPEKNHENGLCGFIDHEGNGHTVMQHHKAFFSLWQLISDEKPSTIIEIGTAAGGLTRFLKFASEELNVNAKIISYDITPNQWHKGLKEMGIDHRIKSCFDPNDTENLNELKLDIQGSGTTLLLCDGGYKINEFKTLSPFLKSGDIIMSHDYSSDRKDFEENVKGKIWSWCESTYVELEPAITANNLLPFRYDEFRSCVWGSFIKS
jgi:cephalosporin hydroxylase